MSQLTPDTCPDRGHHGNPFRYCPTCPWMEEPPPVRGFDPRALIQNLSTEQIAAVADACDDVMRTPGPEGTCRLCGMYPHQHRRHCSARPPDQI